MTEQERDIWRRIYVIHDHYHDMPLDADHFSLLLNEIRNNYRQVDFHPLMLQLGLGLYEYFDGLFQQQRTAEAAAGEQIRIEDVME